MASRRGRQAAALLLIIAIVAAIVPAGCAPRGPGKDNKNSTDGIVISSSLALYIGAVVNNETELTAPLGEPVRRQESQSCIAAGTDVNLEYDGFSITLYPDGNGAHLIGGIKISSAKYATVFGVRPGDSLSAIDPAIYSLKTADGGNYTYIMGESGYFLIASVDDAGNISRIVLGLNS
ncbi:MAG: hypothetical protein J5950_10465 [Clostridia bacterium]|nr:hypothetical protein [Clostridia bacterium]